MSKVEFYNYYADYMRKKKMDLFFSRANRVLHYQIGKCDRLYNLRGRLSENYDSWVTLSP